MVRNVCACPVLATISSSRCEKRNCSQITYTIFFALHQRSANNRRATFTSTIIGRGRRGLHIPCNVIGIAQSVYKQSFQEGECIKKLCTENMKQAGEQAK